MNINGTLNINDPVSKFTSNGPPAHVTAASLDQGGTLVSNGGGMITVDGSG